MAMTKKQTHLFCLEYLTRNFGLSRDSIGPEMIRMFYSDIKQSRESGNRKSLDIRFDDWTETCGDLFNSQNLSQGSFEAIEGSFKIKVNNNDEFLYFLFSLHTYAALVYRSIIINFLISRLNLESKGEIRQGVGLFDSQLNPPDLVAEKIGGLFEETHFTWISCPEAFQLNNGSILPLIEEFKKRRDDLHFPSKLPEKDVLRGFFHELIPRKLRKSLGEFHTPNWLVDITVEASGFTGKKGEKALDPTCGSGTFLRKLIRLKQEKMGVNRTTLEDIIDTIKGYELNPLSQIISISNYLMSLDKLIPIIIEGTEKLILPVYQCDSVCLPMQQNMMEHRGYVNITIANQDIEITKKTILDPSSKNIFMEKDINRMISNYEGRDKDFVIQICSSKIAPLNRFQADFLVGNPPWLNWNNMSEKLKQKTGDIWRGYGLFEFSTGYELSTASDDLAMAVTYVSADKYLTKNGKMAFILPRSFLQSSKGGRGFRKWRLQSPPKLPETDPRKFTSTELKKHLKAKGCYPIKTKKDALVEQYNRELNSQINSQEYESDLDTDLRVLRVIDLSGSTRLPKIPSINPWPGGSVPCMILCLEKGKKTIYPVKLTKLVENQKTDSNNSGSMQFKQLDWSATPYDTEDSLSQWYIAPEEEVGEFVDFCKALKMNKSPYKAVKGWEPAGAKGIHLLNRESMSRIDDNTLCITNDPKRSKKPKPNRETGNVEHNLVYPTISGSDITVWKLKSVRNFAIIPHLEDESDNMSIIPIGRMKEEFPQSLSWLTRFEENCERTLSERKLKGHKSLRRDKNLLSTMEVPWYAVDNIHPKSKGNHTWKPYKLVYNEQGEFGASVISTFKCPLFPEGKIILPDSKTFLIGFDDEDAAHFCAGMFNAPFVRRVVQRFTGELTRGSEVLRLLCPPIFDSSDKLHFDISQISRRIKTMAENEENIEEEEKKLDSLVKTIYSL